jgi:SAM-dependent methyltransferase
MERHDFEQMYQGQAPWDTGRPQPDIVKLAEAGQIRGSVLDVGCGTGENLLYLAGKGHEAWGIDFVPLAIERAKAKAAQRGIDAHFLVGEFRGRGVPGTPSITQRYCVWCPWNFCWCPWNFCGNLRQCRVGFLLGNYFLTLQAHEFLLNRELCDPNSTKSRKVTANSIKAAVGPPCEEKRQNLGVQQVAR